MDALAFGKSEIAVEHADGLRGQTDNVHFDAPGLFIVDRIMRKAVEIEIAAKLTIDASEKTSTTAATPAVVSDTSIADDAELTFDIDVAGTGATGLKVMILGYRT